MKLNEMNQSEMTECRKAHRRGVIMTTDRLHSDTDCLPLFYHHLDPQPNLFYVGLHLIKKINEKYCQHIFKKKMVNAIEIEESKS